MTEWNGGAGPRIVAIGGGTGLSTMLRGLKSRTRSLTAIVTVAEGQTIEVFGTQE